MDSRNGEAFRGRFRPVEHQLRLFSCAFLIARVTIEFVIGSSALIPSFSRSGWIEPANRCPRRAAPRRSYVRRYP
jgi:hypothetical protein